MSTMERISSKQAQAAVLLAEDRLTHAQIASDCRISERTLYNWKRDPAFLAEVKRIEAQLAEAALTRGIAQRWRRLDRLQRDWRRLQKLIEARAAAMAGDVDGGETGLLAHDQKSVGHGENAQVVDVYRFDKAIMDALLNIEKQAAEELGQWVDKVAPTTPDGTKPYDGLDDEGRINRLAALFERARARRAGSAAGE